MDLPQRGKTLDNSSFSRRSLSLHHFVFQLSEASAPVAHNTWDFMITDESDDSLSLLPIHTRWMERDGERV